MKIFRTTDSNLLEQVLSLRFQVLRRECEAFLPEIVRESTVLRDKFDDIAYQYVSVKHGEVVACLRAFDLKDVVQPEALIEKFDIRDAVEHFGFDAIAFTGRLAVAKRLRNTTLAVKLMCMATEGGRQRGIRLAFLVCAPRMVRFYERYGFRQYTEIYNDPVEGYHVPLVLIVRDAGRSFTRWAPSREGDQDSGDDAACKWLDSRRSESFLTHSCGEELLLRLDNLLERHLGGVPTLFKDLSRQELIKLLSKSTILQGKPQDIVLQRGLNDDILVLVLGGSVTLHCATGELYSLGPGDFAGQVDLTLLKLETARLVANEKCELLIIPGSHLRLLLRKSKYLRLKLIENMRCCRRSTAGMAIHSY